MYRNNSGHQGKKDSATLNLVPIRRRPAGRTEGFLSSQTKAILTLLAAEGQGTQQKVTASYFKKENLTKSFS